MNLVVLGSGTSVPHPHRSSPGYWLETQAGTILLDIGPDTVHRMAEEDLDWPNLDAIWISHFHLDHFGGLAPFLFGARWAPQLRSRAKPLRIFGPSGLRNLIETINDANKYKLFEQGFPVDLSEVTAGGKFELLPGLTAETLTTPHTSESLALRLTDPGGTSFAYSSDTGFSEQLADFAIHVTLLLLECSFRRNKPMQTHLELTDAMNLARLCEPQMVVLTHLYPEWDGCNIIAEAGTLWSGRTIEAVDGLRLEF
jgi:ribonuclease BN (tRNA processing enzyme)